MSTHNIGFYEDLTKIIFDLSSNIIKYAPYFFCCNLSVNVSILLMFMSPPCKGQETYCFSPCVCLSVCGSVCPSQNRVRSIT